MAVTRGVEGNEGITSGTAKLFKASNKSSNRMVQKGGKTDKPKLVFEQADTIDFDLSKPIESPVKRENVKGNIVFDKKARPKFRID